MSASTLRRATASTESDALAETGIVTRPSLSPGADATTTISSTTSCSSDRPVVQIVQDWRSDPAPPPTIAVYTNAPRAELLLNGHSLGQCTMRFADYCEWNVSFSPGN
eukprot:COSAG03_NODE_10205_length_665_cov_1.054770_1_plen_107_part_10